MKKLIIFWLLLASTAWGQLYYPTVESGGTLIAANEDTTDRVLLYNSSVKNSRPVNPTLWITNTQIGTPTGHYQMQVITDIAGEALAKAGNGWVRKNTQTFYLSDPDNDVVVPLPFLEGISAMYARWRISFVDGRDGDSTAYKVIYTADAGYPIARPINKAKILTHQEIAGGTGAIICNGVAGTNTSVLDLRIEVSPGVYKLPTKGYLTVTKGIKVDDDTLTIYMIPVFTGNGGSNCDTITAGLSSMSVNYLTPFLSGTAAFPPFVKLTAYNEDLSADDTTHTFWELIVE